MCIDAVEDPTARQEAAPGWGQALSKRRRSFNFFLEAKGSSQGWGALKSKGCSDLPRGAAQQVHSTSSCPGGGAAVSRKCERVPIQKVL